ncbi:MAG TPA: hypothetical protein VN673_12745 [Clostridia bacterium]|nr:hypothetical protein [Clostridia bacterium]
MDTRNIIRAFGVVLVPLCLLGCSKHSLPPNAHVQELGVLKLTHDTPKRLPASEDVSLYCVAGRPEQLPQKVELFATVTHASDQTLRLDIDVVPTPADYQRLGLKHLSVPFRSGERYEFKVSESEWVQFIPTLSLSNETPPNFNRRSE